MDYLRRAIVRGAVPAPLLLAALSALSRLVLHVALSHATLKQPFKEGHHPEQFVYRFLERKDRCKYTRPSLRAKGER